MSSLLPGFEYDIFISYRHKDNKGGRWVTEFVEALKTELEATFKEDISIYFDENPHDGLMETYTVDESLKEKLKCVVFIPIISQTYCDPKSFAWRNEFLEFKRMTTEDNVGMKVKLAGGNVTTRILPVRIHELEIADRKILESELGPLRSIDFVFRSHGVNRPLGANEDHPKDNLNKTYYRDQVNKVAHAVKEIISAINSSSTNSAVFTASIDTPTTLSQEAPSGGKANVNPTVFSKKWLAPMIIVGLIAGTYILYSQLARDSGFTGNEKSIAILPFENIGSEKENEYISDGITQEIINHLSKIEDLSGVTGWTSARLYKKATKSVKQIGQELGVSSIVTGTIQKEGDQLRVIAELIDVNTGKRIWGASYNRTWGDVLSLQSELSQAIAVNLNTQLTIDEIRRLELKVTNNPTAYEAYLKGKDSYHEQLFFASYDSLHARYDNEGEFEERNKDAEKYFIDAIEKDSSFALAWSMLGASYLRTALSFDSVDRFQYYDKALDAAIRGITHGPELSETNMHLAEIIKSVTLNPFTPLHYLQRAVQLNPNNADAFTFLAWTYMETGDFDKVEGSLMKSSRLNPKSTNSSNFMWFYFFTRNKTKLRTLVVDHKVPPSDPMSAYCSMLNHYLDERNDSLLSVAKKVGFRPYIGVAYAKLGQYEDARKLIDTIETQSKLDWFGSTRMGAMSGPQTDIAVTYAWMGEKEKALDHLELAYRLRERALLGLRNNILFDPLRSEKRFQDLLDRMGPN